MRRFPRVVMVGAVVVGGLFGGPKGLFYAAATVAALELLWLRLSLVDLRRPRWQRRHPEPSPDPLLRSFVQVRDEIDCSVHSLREFDRTLRLRLTRVLGVALAERHGVRLSAESQRVSALLSRPSWQLLDPGRAREYDRDRPGVQRSVLETMVADLEAL